MQVQRDHRLDVLRGLAISLALVWHLQPLAAFSFLANLLLLTALGSLYANLSVRWRTRVGLAGLVATLTAFELLSVTSWRLPYYSPLNFVVYIPLADFILRCQDRLARWLWLIGLAYGALVCQDVAQHLSMVYGGGYGAVYSRASLVVGALAVVLAFRRFRIPRARSLELAGRYSLGLFIVHKWVWYGAVALLVPRLAATGHAQYEGPLLVFALTVAVSCLLVAALARTPARFLVTGGGRQNGGGPAQNPRADLDDMRGEAQPAHG